jgi:hypothetical protein
MGLNLYLSDTDKSTYSRPTLSVDKKTLTFVDTSGVYTPVANPSGWGTPNPLTTSLNASNSVKLTLTITINSTDTAVIYGPKSLIGPTALVPNSPADVNALIYPVTTTFMGITDATFPDGFYELTYTDEAGTIIYEGTFIIVRTIEETINTHALEVPDYYMYVDKFINNYGGDEVMDVCYEIALLNSIKNSIPSVENLPKIISTIETLQDIISEV